jgi:hypothetical protein
MRRVYTGTPAGAQGECLVPPYTRGSVSLSLSLRVYQDIMRNQSG